MTLKIKIEVPIGGGPYEAQVAESNGNPARVLVPGESVELYVHSGNTIAVTELPFGTKANLAAQDPQTELPFGTKANLAAQDPQTDFPLGKACDLSGEGNCEACQ